MGGLCNSCLAFPTSDTEDDQRSALPLLALPELMVVTREVSVDDAGVRALQLMQQAALRARHASHSDWR